MSKAVVIGAVVIIGVGVAGGGGYYYASQKAEQKFQEKITLIKKTFPESSLTYEKHHISIFSQETTLDKVIFKNKRGTAFTADKVDIVLGSGNVISKLSIDKFAIKDKNNPEFTINHINLTDAKTEPGWVVMQDSKVKNMALSKISFGLLNLQNIEVKEDNSPRFTLAEFQIKNYGLNQKTDVILKDLTTIDRRSNFTLASIKIEQINQAEIIKKIEDWTNKNSIFASRSATNKAMFNGLSEVQVGLFSFDNLQYNEKRGLTFKIRHYELKDYGIGRKTSTALKDFSISSLDNRNGYVKLATFENSGVDLASFFQLMQKINMTNYNTMLNSFTQLQMDQAKNPKEMKVQTTIAGFQLSFLNQTVSLGSLTGVSQSTAQGNYNETYELTNFDFSLPSYNFNEYIQALKEVGYNKISISGQLSTQYQKDTGVLTMALNNLSFKDMGKVSASLKFRIPFELLVAFYIDSDKAIMNPEVQFIEFTSAIQSTGLMNKIVQKLAKDQNISEDDARKNIALAAKQGMGELSKFSPTLAENAAKAFAAFVQNPQKNQIEITAIPTKPIPFVDIQRKSIEISAPTQSTSALDTQEKIGQEIVNLFNLQVKAAPIK